jgi:hypothetical protein
MAKHLDMLESQLRGTDAAIDALQGVRHSLAIELLRPDASGVI